MSGFLWPRGLCNPWNSPDQNTGLSSLSLLQRTFPTQGSNPGLPHYRWILYQMSHKGSIKLHYWNKQKTTGIVVFWFQQEEQIGTSVNNSGEAGEDPAKSWWKRKTGNEMWQHVRGCCCCCSVLSPVQLFATSWTIACQTSLSFTISWSLLMSGVQWTELENGVIVRSKGKGRIKLDSYVSNFVDLRERYI